MPLYDRKCAECGWRDETYEPINDMAQIECPECGALSFQKQYTSPGFVRVAGEGAGAFFDEVETKRIKSSNEHGTTTVKATYDKHGLHQDDVLTNGR